MPRQQTERPQCCAKEQRPVDPFDELNTAQAIATEIIEQRRQRGRGGSSGKVVRGAGIGKAPPWFIGEAGLRYFPFVEGLISGSIRVLHIIVLCNFTM